MEIRSLLLSRRFPLVRRPGLRRLCFGATLGEDPRRDTALRHPYGRSIFAIGSLLCLAAAQGTPLHTEGIEYLQKVGAFN